MTGTLSHTALAWLLTYAIHSTLLLALVWVVTGAWGRHPAARDLLWKVALLGGVVTADEPQRTGPVKPERPTKTEIFAEAPQSSPALRVAPASSNRSVRPLK